MDTARSGSGSYHATHPQRATTDLTVLPNHPENDSTHCHTHTMRPSCQGWTNRQQRMHDPLHAMRQKENGSCSLSLGIRDRVRARCSRPATLELYWSLHHPHGPSGVEKTTGDTPPPTTLWTTSRRSVQHRRQNHESGDFVWGTAVAQRFSTRWLGLKQREGIGVPEPWTYVSVFSVPTTASLRVLRTAKATSTPVLAKP